ncbi:hypothetical protein NRB20_29120 [Nocardia sp. RB20]|uniref:Major facilitator superfamily (MFS) profile domain-containing protein n=1 Tax=Nocardia macrotermitis TaxID=2585198 RepID=A0A7K0D286_9NOCA|nr:hypothetical protein [Nocardia macrotermitis]
MAGGFGQSVRFIAVSVVSARVVWGLFGGTAPFIATWLIDVTGNSLAPAGYFVVCAVLTLGAALFVRETRGIELPVD